MVSFNLAIYPKQCARCGALMRFVPKHNLYKCDSCGAVRFEN